MTNSLNSLFQAHNTDPDFLIKNCNHYYCDVLSLASVTASADFVTQPFQHMHEEYEFLIPYGPIPMIQHDESVYFGEPGFVYPIQSMQTHTSRFPISNIPHDNVVVEKQFMERLLRESGYEGKEFELRFGLTQDAKTYIQYFKEEFSKKEQCNQHKLMHLASLIVTVFIENEFSQNRKQTKEAPQYQQGLHKVASYINHHYTENLQIEDLAAMCNLSKSYFIAAFHKEIGDSPYNYLNRLRIANARILLENTKFTIKEIALQCGFMRANSFTSLFKASTGMTPTQYRAALHEKKL